MKNYRAIAVMRRKAKQLEARSPGITRTSLRFRWHIANYRQAIRRPRA